MIKNLRDTLQHTLQLSEETLQDAEQVKAEKGGTLGEILVRKKIIDEAQLLQAFSAHYDLPFWQDLPLDNISHQFIDQVSIQFLKRYLMVPLEDNGRAETTDAVDADGNQAKAPDTPSRFIIAINNPSHLQPLDDLVRLLDIKDYQIVLATKEAILSAINISYDLGRDSAEQLVQDMEEDSSAIISEIEDTSDLLDDDSDAPIIKLVNHVISQASKARASDIHIEPYQNTLKIRYRVDGILYDLITPPKWIQPALTSRIKVMAKLNIAEKRLPQDGRFDVKVGDQEIDVRVSTIPTSFGERVVLRLLNKTGSLLEMGEIGFAPARLELLKTVINSSHGIILLTGPTGSGKTTTLYAILSSINTPDINIITIEDPVEYQLEGISQIQVNPKIDLTFARGLRSIVRQDPDVILVGEIRDRETAEIAVQSALTGHLVFSTLHTNDSAGAITRLVDIGVEPFLISSSVLAVAAQRLVRILCDHCKEAYTPDAAALASIEMTPQQIKGQTIYRATGCEQCFNTGYTGRKAIFEIMVMAESLKSLILKNFDANQIRQEAMTQGLVTLRQDGIEKVVEGITTIEEVFRVTQK